jgi:hypothetical protein
LEAFYLSWREKHIGEGILLKLEAFYLSWREKHIGEGILLKVKGKTYR